MLADRGMANLFGSSHTSQTSCCTSAHCVRARSLFLTQVMMQDQCDAGGAAVLSASIFLCSATSAASTSIWARASSIWGWQDAAWLAKRGLPQRRREGSFMAFKQSCVPTGGGGGIQQQHFHYVDCGTVRQQLWLPCKALDSIANMLCDLMPWDPGDMSHRVR